MSSLALLPVEIHGRVADFITSTHDLSHYLLLCRGIFGEVERRLYRSIRLTKYEPHIFAAFIQGLLDNPHRPLVVREFSIRSKLIQVLQDFIPQLASALALMTNITHLCLTAPNFQFKDFTLNNYPFKLKRLEYSTLSSFRHDESLPNFLISQPSRTNLAVTLYIPTERMPPYFLPTNLKILRGSVFVGTTARPYLPVTVERLHWIPEGYHVFRSGHLHLVLRVLKLSSDPFAFHLATICPNLIYLEFMPKYSVSDAASVQPQLTNSRMNRPRA